MLDAKVKTTAPPLPSALPTEAAYEGQAAYKRPSVPRKAASVDASPTALAATAPARLFSPPKLTHPRAIARTENTSCTEFALIRALGDLHETGQSLIGSFTHSIQEGSTRLRQLSMENIQKLKEAAERTKENGFWSFLQKIGECILAAISTVLGITLVATGAGAVVGGVMIAAGILTLTNFAMRETGSWDWVAKQLAKDRETQDKLAFYLPLGVGLIAAVLGIGGSLASALWSSLNFAQQALSIAQAAMGVYQGVTSIGKGVTQARVLWTQAELTKIESENTLGRIAFERDTNLLRQIVKKLESAQQTAEQIISLAVDSYRKTVIHA